jgi:hypothetical protein
MYEFFLVELLDIFCFSAGLREKYATSEPEINAENTNRSTITSKQIATPVVKG